MSSITSINYFNSIYHTLSNSELKCKIVFVGIQGLLCPSQIIDEIDNTYSNVKTEYVWMRKNIRSLDVPDEALQTAAGYAVNQVLNDLEKEGFTNIETSFDLAVMKSEDAPGRSDIVTADGLTKDEMCEVSYLLGKNKFVRSVIINEFNPGIETTKTGDVMINMFSSFVKGATER